MNKKNLPIKIIMQRSSDITPNIPNGKPKFFGDVNKDLQDEVINKLERLSIYYDDLFNETEVIPAIVKIKVKKEAIAKSYKPDRFCKNMPIIGSEELDEVFCKVTKAGIERTIREVESLPAIAFKANLTAIDDITPYYDEEKISDSLRKITAAEFSSIDNSIRIKLFSLDTEYEDEILKRYVVNKLNNLGLDNNIKFITYGDKIQYIKVKLESYEQIQEISKINGIRKIDFFCKYYSSNEHSITEEVKFSISENLNTTDTIIGIIDSGISDFNPYIKDYIYAREQYVPDAYINPTHGTFVASTIQYSDLLNDIDSGNNKVFKFLDVVALPNSDEEYGPVDGIGEDSLMEIIDEVVSKYCKRVKIWNLSLGIESIICNGSMSSLGAFCDYIQEKYNVQFFISSGNKNIGDLRRWPTQFDDDDDSDRIISPADSVRAITVGAIALKDSDNSVVKAYEPSPFSRRGPGANYIVKPDVVDFGGNCTLNKECQNIGIKGMDPNGNIVEMVGTSFSTPRVAKKYASIMDEINDPDILLSKALLIHSAKINSGTLEKKEDIKYYGFGMPHNNIQDAIMCSEDEITLVFKQTVYSGSHLELVDFPYPESLIREGKYFGEIFMTLVYNPPLNIKFGKEYCRSNIDVGFGPYRFNEEGKMQYKSEVPREVNWESKYEAEQVENGFKWSPIKSYHRKISKGIGLGDGWKLRVDMQGRYKETIASQDFVLIITIKDTSGRADIYSEVVNGLRKNGYIMNDLEVRSKIKSRN